VTQNNYCWNSTASGAPGIFSTTLVAVVTGLLLLYMFVGLRLSIRAQDAPEQHRMS
jgi:hypothetical protein